MCATVITTPKPQADVRIERAHWLPAAGLLMVLALTVGAYWSGLSGGLMVDDIGNLAPLKELGTGKLRWHEVVGGNESGPLGRPIAMLSFVGDWVSTGARVWRMKYNNLMLHLLCGTLIFWLSARLLKQPVTGAGEARWWVALWVASAWLFAPLLVSTVLYVVQRMAQLSALFTLAGLLSYVIGRQMLEDRFIQGALVIVLGFILFLPLAAFSKENGVLLPLLAFVIEIFFFQLKGSSAVKRLLYIFFACVLLLPAVGVSLKLTLGSDWVTHGYAHRDFTLYERLLTQSRALLDYVANLLLPRGAAMGVFQDDYAKSAGLLSPPSTVFAIVAWLLILFSAWWYRGTRLGLLFFGPVFFLAGHALESTVFPLELYFEHRNYLPSFGIFLAMGIGATYLFRVWRYKKLLVLVLLLLPIGYAAASHLRALTWQSSASQFVAAERTHPNSRRLQLSLAALYVENNNLEGALEHAERAATLYGSEGSTGIALFRLHAHCVTVAAVPEDEYVLLQQSPNFDHDQFTINALTNLARDFNKCPGADVRPLVATLEDWWDETGDTVEGVRGWTLHFTTARLLASVERKAEAIAHLDAASRLLPERLISGLLAVEYRLNIGDLEGARFALNELRKRDNGDNHQHTLTIQSFETLMGKIDEVEANSRATPPT